VKAIEGCDEIATSITRQRIDGHVVQMHVLYSGLPCVFFCELEGNLAIS
jgi:hypothetical protein